MLTLSFDSFKAEISQNNAEIKKLIEEDLPRIIGVESVNHFKENFQQESFDQEPWLEVERRKIETRSYLSNLKYHPARNTRKILTGDSGDLERSIQYTTESGKVLIHSDLVYADVHNSGLRAGRGSGFLMPKRQFINDSEKLHNIITKIINDKMDKIL